jgi:hypothetical protein
LRAVCRRWDPGAARPGRHSFVRGRSGRPSRPRRPRSRSATDPERTSPTARPRNAGVETRRRPAASPVSTNPFASRAMVSASQSARQRAGKRNSTGSSAPSFSVTPSSARRAVQLADRCGRAPRRRTGQVLMR